MNFVLEELLHKAAISTFLTQTSESDNEMCSKHKESPLNFHCESHNVKVCHSCTVRDHPVVSCRLLSLDQVDDKCKKMKQTQIAAILDQRSALIDMEIYLERDHHDTININNKAEAEKKDLEKDLQLLSAKIKKITQKIAINDLLLKWGILQKWGILLKWVILQKRQEREILPPT